MIKNIKLKSGRALGIANTNVDALPITVFVGPNNSGKSQILREINQFCMDGNDNSNNKIIQKGLIHAEIGNNFLENLVGWTNRKDFKESVA